MRILYEDTMPHAGAYLSTLGDATPYQWQTIQPDDLIDIDAFAVRSTTRVDAALLAKANKLKYIATATAGSNHLAIDTIESRGIEWFAAAGCNAVAVAQYVVSALLVAEQEKGLTLSAITVGIVGAGNVGTAVSKMLDALSIDYVLCDPPIEHTDPRAFVDLDTVLGCDVISLHVPYTTNTEHPTENMLSAERLAQLSEDQWLINACRGEVVDEPALLRLKQAGKGPNLILDVWQNEPDIDQYLFDHVFLGTPHIAGHTLEGKVRGTQMVYDWLRPKLMSDFHGKPLTLDDFLPIAPPMEVSQQGSSVSQLLLRAYDIQFDHRHLAQNVAQSGAFSSLRKNYNIRREYTAYRLTSSGSFSATQQAVLTQLGFALSP